VDTYSATGSWGSVANKWYSGDTPAVLDGAAAGGSDETHYVENVFRLSMGASDYYPSGGY